MTIIAKTERTFIRQFTYADIVELAPILADPEVMQFSVSGTISLEKVIENLEHIYIPSYQDPVTGVWAVIHQASGKLIGFCGLVRQQVEQDTYIELGYRLAKAFWELGLGTEVTSAMKEYAFDKGIEEIIAIIDPRNIRSIRVAKKIGMHYKQSAVYFGIPIHVYHCLAHDFSKR